MMTQMPIKTQKSFLRFCVKIRKLAHWVLSIHRLTGNQIQMLTVTIFNWFATGAHSVHFRIFHQMLGLFLGHTQYLSRRKKLLEVQTGQKNSENSRAVVCVESGLLHWVGILVLLIPCLVVRSFVLSWRKLTVQVPCTCTLWICIPFANLARIQRFADAVFETSHNK